MRTVKRLPDRLGLKTQFEKFFEICVDVHAESAHASRDTIEMGFMGGAASVAEVFGESLRMLAAQKGFEPSEDLMSVIDEMDRLVIDGLKEYYGSYMTMTEKQIFSWLATLNEKGDEP